MKKLTALCLSLGLFILACAPSVFAEEYRQLYYGNETVMEIQPKTNDFLVLHPENEPNIDLSYSVSCDPEIGAIDKLEDGVVNQYMLRVSDRKPGITGKIYAEKEGVKYAIDVKLVYPKEGFYLTPDKTPESYVVRGNDGRYTLEYTQTSRSIYYITSGATLDSVVANSKDVMTTLSADKTVAVITAKSTMKGDNSVIISYFINDGGKTVHNIQTVLFKEYVEPGTEPTEPVEDPKEPEEELLPGIAYSDVEKGAWYEESVDYVTRRGIFNGYDNGQFGVNDGMSRAMTSMVLWRIAGKPEISGDNPFDDVSDTAWYAPQVVWAADKGYIKGIGLSETGENLFLPDGNVTVEQLCTLLFRMSGSPSVPAERVEGASDWAQSAMKWAVTKGIVSVGADGVDPQGTASRARVANIIMNYKMLDNK